MIHVSRIAAAALVCGSLACASKPPASSQTPEVKIKRVSTVQIMQVETATRLPLNFEIEITNPLSRPVTLTSIEVETVGVSGAYGMKRMRHGFSKEIAAHGTHVVQLRAWANRLQQSENGGTTSPVLLRGTAKFNSSAGVMQTAFVSRGQ